MSAQFVSAVRSPYRFIACCVSLFLAMTSLPSVGFAALVENDFLSSGDTLLTQDSDTGMEWLDVSYTRGAGRSVVRNGYKDLVTTHGFRYATQLEVANFFYSAGISDLTNSFSDSNLASVEYLQELIGITATYGWGDYSWADGPLTSGLVELDNPIIFQSAVATLQVADFFPGARATVSDYMAQDSVSMSWAGSFLVRDIQAVPVPATAWLLGTAISLLVWLRRASV